MKVAALDDQQRDLAALNNELIQSFMANHRLREDDVTDWYGLLAEGLCLEPLGYIMFAPFAYLTMEYVLAAEKHNSESIRQILSHTFYFTHLSNAYAITRASLKRIDNRMFSALAANGFDFHACALTLDVDEDELRELYAHVLFEIDMMLNDGQSFIQ